MRVHKLGRWVGRLLTVAVLGAGATFGGSSLAMADEQPGDPGNSGWEEGPPDNSGWEIVTPNSSGWE
jgi:hypothetical protein